MKKTLIFAVTIVATGLIILYNMGLYPFIVFQGNENSDNYPININDENKPFQHIDFENGKYSALIVIDMSDMIDLPVNIPRHRILKTSDKQILNQLKTCEFTPSGGDLATVESRIFL